MTEITDEERAAVLHLRKRLGRVPTHSELSAVEQALVYSFAVKAEQLLGDLAESYGVIALENIRLAEQLQAKSDMEKGAMDLGVKRG
jgi:hypothetical protein